MKKRILSLLLSIVMMLGLMPTAVLAEDIPTSLPFTLSVGTVTDYVEKGYTYYGMEYAPNDPNADQWGYIYSECSVDLYTVTLPYGTQDLTLTFSEDRIAYGYDSAGDYKNSCAADVEIGYENNGQTGETTANVRLVDDRFADFIRVQTPYDEEWSSTTLYAVKFEYTHFFTITVNGHTAVDADITFSANAYNYKSYDGESTSVPVFTVTVPQGTGTVGMGFTDNVLLYNYASPDNYISGWYGDATVGGKNATVSVDANSDGAFDFIQVQKPYNSDRSGGELLYVMTFNDSTTHGSQDGGETDTPTTDSLLAKIAASYTENSSEWGIMDMAAYAKTRPNAASKTSASAKQAYINTAISALQNPNLTDTTCDKAILSLTGLGVDVTKLYPVNSNTPINAISLLNGVTQSSSAWSAPYTLAAYAQGNYGTNFYENSLLTAVLANQQENGSWEEFGTVDTTGNMIAALAFYQNRDDVREAIDKAITYLSGQQKETGVFDDGQTGTWAAGSNANSTAMVIIGLAANGINPATDTRFIKNGKSLLDGLLSFARSDSSGFSYTNNTPKNELATEQGFRALIAASQVIATGKAYNVYDFSDATVVPMHATGQGSTQAPKKSTGDTITVSVTIKADTGYWMKNKSVTIPGTDATVYHAFVKALDNSGVTQAGAESGYVRSMEKSGRILAEFTNGENSGWLYKVNGILPDVGLTSHPISNGDNIVWYYTNDWTLDPDTATFMDNPKNIVVSGTSIKVKATISGNTATAIITADAIKASVENAMKSGDNTVKIALKDTGKAETIAAAIPAVGIKSIISDTRAALNIESCKGSISIPNDTLKAIAEQLGNTDLSVSVATKPASEIKAENINTKDAVIVEVTLCANDKAITSFGGNALNLSIPVNDKFEVGKRYRVKEISADGSVKTLTGKCVIESGEPVMQTSTTGLSIFVVTTDVVNAFADTVGHWYTDAINYAAENGLMNGTADGLFSPDVTLSRAMVVTILARLDGAARTTGEHWYSSAQQWSIHNGISDGTNMAGDISREQLAVMLYRYAKLKGYDTVKRADLSCFEDYGSVHSWAQSAMSWANASGLISGRSATALAPRGNTTRAEAAAILMRFCETTSKTTESDDAKLNAALTNAASAVLKAAPAPTVGSIGGEWAVIGLVRSEAIVPSDYFAAYVERVSDYVKKSSGILSTRKCTEYSRITLALTMVGQDASSFASYDLTSPLLDYDKVLSQGINGPIWALLALDSGNYAAGNKEIRQKYVDYILSKQFADGGWNLSGTSADADITAMALQALAKYQGQSSVKSAVNAALSCLSKMQNNDGSFSSGELPTAESCAQVLIALSVLDISADDSRFVKSGATVLDALLNYQLSDGSFCHITGGTSNQMAAEQALLALVAVKATQSGKSIYQLDSELRHAA